MTCNQVVATVHDMDEDNPLAEYAKAMARERQKWDAIYEWLPCLFRCVLTAMALEVATRNAHWEDYWIGR